MKYKKSTHYIRSSDAAPIGAQTFTQHDM